MLIACLAPLDLLPRDADARNIEQLPGLLSPLMIKCQAGLNYLRTAGRPACSFSGSTGVGVGAAGVTKSGSRGDALQRRVGHLDFPGASTLLALFSV